MADIGIAHTDNSSNNIQAYMKNIAEVLDKLEDIQNKIGPLEFTNVEPGLRGSLLKLFQACCPLARNKTDDQLWEEHKRIRSLLLDEHIPKSSHIKNILSQRDRQESMEALFEWAAKKGAEISKVKFDLLDSNYFLVAKENIEPNSPFTTIPKKLMILADDFLKHETFNKLISKDPVLAAMPTVLLSYGLLMEFYSGHESEYWPYLESLPETYQNSCYYDIDEMLLLKGTSSFRDALYKWKGVVRQYAYFHLKIIEHSNSDQTELRELISHLNLHDRFSYEDYRWAAATVMSRSLSLQTTAGYSYSLSLIPILDLCNHSETISNLDFDVVDNVTRISNEFEITSGERVGLFYGARTNNEFVLSYGFFYDNNIHDFVVLRLPLPKDDPLISVKHKLLVNLGLCEYNGIPIGTYYPEPWSGDIVPYMRIYVATEEDLSIIRSFPDENIRTRMLDTTPISQSNEEEAKTSLINILSDKIKTYESSNPDQNLVNEDKNTSYKAKCIIKLRMFEFNSFSALLSRLASGDTSKSEEREQ